MYEIATLAGSRLIPYPTAAEPSYPLNSYSVEGSAHGVGGADGIIMGQIASSVTANSGHNNNNNHHHATAGRNGKRIYHRHSSVQPALAIRVLKKENSFTVGGGKESGAARLRDSMQKARTESKNIDQYGLLITNGAGGASNGASAASSTAVPAPPFPSNATTASTELTALVSSESAADVDRSASSIVDGGGGVGGSSSKEFFKSGEDTYHRTDCCYYRTMDNGYHKLPSDSYHKTTEGCYVKLPDGSFRKLAYPTGGGSASTVGTADEAAAPAPVQYRVRNPMLKFLKRSKSHTPATIAQLQKEKEAKDKKDHHRLSTIQSSDAHVTGRQQAAAAAAALLHHSTHHHHQKPSAGALPVSHQQQQLSASAVQGQQQLSNGQQQNHTGHHHHHHHHHYQNPPSASSIVEQTSSLPVPPAAASGKQQSGAVPNHQNRRVMVTMIDGGLPVVAKSKPIHDKPKSAKSRVQEVKRDKVNMGSNRGG